MASRDAGLAIAGQKPHPLEVTPFARSYSHIHTILVLTLYYTRFHATVEDPVLSLLQLVAPVAGLQVVYCAVCIHTLSTPMQKTQKLSGTQPQTLRKFKPRQTGDSVGQKIFPAFLSGILSLTIATPLLFVLIVLHGAPITSHLAHTALTALHLATLAMLPLFFTNGVGGKEWRSLVGLMAPIDELYGAALGACIGAWVGAVPIPLDWDREWQKWPVTVLYGIVAGWAVGKTLGGTLLHGFKMTLDK